MCIRDSQILERVLKEYHENLFIDLSWVVLGSYVYKDLDGWVSLIKKYPDNFLIGSDSVGKIQQHPDGIEKISGTAKCTPDRD